MMAKMLDTVHTHTHTHTHTGEFNEIEESGKEKFSALFRKDKNKGYADFCNIVASKGITLIALVVTIIVLLILAGVTINLVVGNNGIITRAREAKEKTEQAALEEKKSMASLDASMNTQNQMYTDKNGDTVIIPAGFALTGIEGENTVDDGLVIIDKNGNEFVWIPVENPNEVYGIDSNGKLYGKLYSYTADQRSNLNWTENNGIMQVPNTNTGTDSNREPTILVGHPEKIGDDNAEGIKLLKNMVGIVGNSDDEILNAWDKELNTYFKKTMDTIEKYKGFYISRYEIAYENGTIYSKKNLPAMTSDVDGVGSWYGLYAKSREYKETNVNTCMIWGAQYDAMLKWFQETGIDVTAEPKDFNKDMIYTGVNETDKVKNIYDLYGGRVEWTLEGVSKERRNFRGGYAEQKNCWSLSHRLWESNLWEPVGLRTTRITLIIE